MSRSLLVLLVLLAGCGGSTVRIRGVVPLNRNADGESTTVDVRFYQLRDQARFQGAAFAALWTEAEKTLGPDLIGPPVVITVLPGAAGDPPRRVEVAAAPWIGVMALMRSSDGQARTAVLPGDRLSDAVIELSGYGIRVDGLAETPPPGEVQPASATTPPATRAGRQ